MPLQKATAGLLALTLKILETYPAAFNSTIDNLIKIIDVTDADESLDRVERQSEASVVRYSYGESHIKVIAIHSLLI